MLRSTAVAVHVDALRIAAGEADVLVTVNTLETLPPRVSHDPAAATQPDDPAGWDHDPAAKWISLLCRR